MVVDASGKYGGFSINNAMATFNSSFTNAAGATFSGINSTVTIGGNVTNQGTWFIDPSTFIFNGNFTNTGTITTDKGDTFEFLTPSGTTTANLTIDLGGITLPIGALIIGQGVTLTVTDGTLTYTALTEPTALSITTGSGGSISQSAVPIPGAILLFAPGLVGLAAIRKRFKK